ncbi:hypothetical protein JRQ81_005237 [Phrynocephalus forsythii]|uniref:U2A'/phosphoprotein 32 family A C-terminal domain-containing protein n=1 Tax=Phrynocephalus forsythii TaxID=171643 RepID=A0A9Q0XGE5_9SAUR|nr:hypothetical protein JRQ81_005237 [Phrynocephalus forsythii]
MREMRKYVISEKHISHFRSQALTSLQVLRLDRENINHITSMQGLEQIHSIYLQQNHIQKIENLSSFPNLKFLSLAGNCISEVENLRSLTKLQFLDLSQNCIETLDTDELPQNLVVLDLTGNKCTKQDGYRERVWAALPHLKRLDAKDIPIQKAPIQKKKEEEEEEDSSEDTDYEDWPEFSRPLSAEKDFFVGLHSEFTSRSARRQEEAIKEHEARLEELKQQQKLRQLVFNTSQSSSEVQGGSEPATPAPEDNIPQTEQHTVSNSNSLSEATNPTFQIRPSTLKGKAEGASSAQGKNSKEKVPSSTKTTIKRVNK